jgi:hypothetical protein
MIGLDTSKDASLRLFNTWADTKLVQLFDDVKSDTYKGTSEIWLDNWHLI